MDEQLPYYITLARGIRPLPSSYSLTALTTMTRTRLKALGDDCNELLCHEPDVERDALMAIPLSFLHHNYSPWEDIASAHNEAPDQLFELLRVLSSSNRRARSRRADAIAYVLDELDFFSGFMLEVERGVRYQFGNGTYWVSSGNFIQNDHFVCQNVRKPDVLRKAGFVRASLNGYIERARTPIIRLQLSDDGVLEPWVAIIALYTASRQERGDFGELFGVLKKEVFLLAHERLEHRGATVPMKPLFSLPREMRGLNSFFVSRAQDLELDERGFVRSPDVPRAGARLHATPRAGRNQAPQQQVLFFDDDLVAKSSGGADTFICVELEHEQTDVFRAVLAAIEQLDIDPNVLEHVPRICAGVFSAAQRDRRHRFLDSGSFWDTDSGSRLCQIVGFDPDNHKHRQRIQQARALLETIVLHRSVRTVKPDGVTEEVRWMGPLLEKRQAKLDLSRVDREGMSDRHVFSSWSIARPLWDMVLPEREGGAPAFMSIDERAFLLDRSSSTNFNLYWTMVNRAYMGMYANNPLDRVDETGTFHPTINVLYNFSGFQGKYRRPYRLKAILRDALDNMVEHGLLLSWECPWLDEGTSISLQDLFTKRVAVTFSEHQLKNLQRSVQAAGHADRAELAAI